MPVHAMHGQQRRHEIASRHEPSQARVPRGQSLGRKRKRATEATSLQQTTQRITPKIQQSLRQIQLATLLQRTLRCVVDWCAHCLAGCSGHVIRCGQHNTTQHNTGCSGLTCSLSRGTEGVQSSNHIYVPCLLYRLLKQPRKERPPSARLSGRKRPVVATGMSLFRLFLCAVRFCFVRAIEHAHAAAVPFACVHGITLAWVMACSRRRPRRRGCRYRRHRHRLP